jgi:hypothetical protein
MWSAQKGSCGNSTEKSDKGKVGIYMKKPIPKDGATEFENRIIYKLHRRVGGNTMIHYVGASVKTLCGIEIESPIRHIDPYDNSSIVDNMGMIVTGFSSTLYYEQVGVDRKAQSPVKPTCAECARLLQQMSHHCNIHGYLKGHEVTFNEKCIYCGNTV